MNSYLIIYILLKDINVCDKGAAVQKGFYNKIKKCLENNATEFSPTKIT